MMIMIDRVPSLGGKSVDNVLTSIQGVSKRFLAENVVFLAKYPLNDPVIPGTWGQKSKKDEKGQEGIISRAKGRSMMF